MKLNLRELSSKRKFFYPLAEPTYGEREVFSALNSMTSYSTTMWDKVKEFEKIFGDKYGGEAIMVNSGSSADLLISFGISEKSGGSLPPGSEILVPSVTWPTHLWSLVMAGFKVKLIDIDPKTLNFDLEHIERNISKDTRGIFIVHLLGNMGDMRGLTKLCKENNLVLMEDCCEALGSKFDGEYAGTFGIASSFSFFFSHHLVTMEGGMILTKDKEFAKRCRLLRAHGWDREVFDPAVSADSDIDSRYKFVAWGFNLRPTELQAGFGIEQIKKIDQYQALRDQNAAVLEECINRNFNVSYYGNAWDNIPSELMNDYIITDRTVIDVMAFSHCSNSMTPYEKETFENVAKFLIEEYDGVVNIEELIKKQSKILDLLKTLF
jgi:CDP-6-deoxy-D-xylo-4-hexulose-3-dehydrase